MARAAQKRFTVVKSRRIYVQIAEQITALIRSDEWKPGERLPAERDLSLQLGVGRPAVREALIWLEATGLIQVKPGDGAFVRSHVAPQSADQEGDLGPGPLEQIEARLLIEPQVAALAAKNCRMEDVEDLAVLLEQMRNLDSRGDDVGGVRYRFHTKLAEMSGNSFLAATVKQLWDLRAREMWRTLRSWRARPASSETGKPLSTTSALHATEQIVQALRNRDPEGARWAMETMIRGVQHIYFDREV